MPKVSLSLLICGVGVIAIIASLLATAVHSIGFGIELYTAARWAGLKLSNTHGPGCAASLESVTPGPFVD